MSYRITGVSFLLIFIACSCSYGQNDWREGFIIQHSGDTIYGFIDYRDYKSNSQFCYFRDSAKSRTQKLAPDQILGYRYLDSKYFVSKAVPVLEEEGKVFLELLIKGDASIYFYRGEDDHYFLEQDGQMYELKNSKAVVHANGKRFWQAKKEYIGMLNYHFRDAHMQNAIQNTEFNHKSLIKTTKKYHEKVGKGEEYVVFRKKTKPVKINYGIVFGTNYKTIYFDDLANYKINRKYSNYGGVAINIQNIPGIYERFSLQLGILASSYYLEADNTYPETDQKRYSLNIPIMLSYQLTTTKLYPKLEMGASSYFIQSELLKVQYIVFAAGVSLNYDFYKDYRIFIRSRYESTGILRFGAGVLF